MNTLMPLKKFMPQSKRLALSANTFVVHNKSGIPIGFVFGRDSFISLLEQIDNQFEELVEDKTKAFHNPAGELIDAIEEQLPVNAQFVHELQQLHRDTKSTDWIPMEQVNTLLNV